MCTLNASVADSRTSKKKKDIQMKPINFSITHLYAEIFWKKPKQHKIPPTLASHTILDWTGLLSHRFLSLLFTSFLLSLSTQTNLKTFYDHWNEFSDQLKCFFLPIKLQLNSFRWWLEIVVRQVSRFVAFNFARFEWCKYFRSIEKDQI
jgi:hypothetical protein